MCSIRNCVTLVILGASMLAVGCQRMGNTPPEQLNPTPIVVDEAMQHRDWDQQAAYYTNTSVVARPTGELYEVKPDLGAERRHIYVDPVVWAGNTLLMPFVLIADPPWTPVAYRGETIEPTYTAQPPLDEAPAPLAD